MPCFQIVGDRHGFTQSGGVIFGTGNQLSTNGASILGGVGNTASGQYSAIVGGNGAATSDFASTATGGGKQLACTSNFVPPSGIVNYVANTVIPSLAKITCTGSVSLQISYTASPPMSSLGGSVALNSSFGAGFLTGTTGSATTGGPKWFDITVVDSVTGMAGYLGLKISISPGEFYDDVACHQHV